MHTKGLFGANFSFSLSDYTTYSDTHDSIDFFPFSPDVSLPLFYSFNIRTWLPESGKFAFFAAIGRWTSQYHKQPSVSNKLWRILVLPPPPVFLMSSMLCQPIFLAHS